MSTSPAVPSTLANVASTVSEIVATGNTILSTIETVDPALAPTAAVIELLDTLATSALNAYSAAQGNPITVTTVGNLLPFSEAPTPPTA